GAGLLEQAEEVAPSRLVDRLVAVLRGVAAGRIDDHRLLGEIPIAVARAAFALDLLRAETLGERKALAGIEQRRGLAAAGRPDDHVPRELVEVAAARVAAHGAHLRERLGQLAALLRALRVDRLRLFVLGRRHRARDALDQLFVLFARTQAADQQQ